MATFSWGEVDQILIRALDGVSARQRATANNIANANTPGYKRMFVPFEAVLQQELRGEHQRGLSRTHPKHLMGKRGASSFSASRSWTTMRNDGSGVDIDIEMTQLAKDSLLYNALVQQVSSRYAALRTAIREGR